MNEASEKKLSYKIKAKSGKWVQMTQIVKISQRLFLYRHLGPFGRAFAFVF